MSVGFGFSAGDFIAALELVTTVVNALRESGGASAEYHALLSQLYTLETALLRVKRLELDESKYAEAIALRQAAAQSQRTIDGFLEKIKKYQPSLRSGGSGNRIKDVWRKVSWVVCKKDDLVSLKADLLGHTESIELLLTTVQMAGTRIEAKKNDQNHRSLIGMVQDSYFQIMGKLTILMERASTGIRQGKQLIETTTSILQTNVRVFQAVLEIQQIITRIPGQIDRQQPVHFINALGRHTPFHLEFITCKESLIAVLYNNFRTIGHGGDMIQNSEFVIQDLDSKMDLDLEMPWQSCFTPGQNVAMSMVFESFRHANAFGSSCPKCKSEQEGKSSNNNQDLECRRCKAVYRLTPQKNYRFVHTSATDPLTGKAVIRTRLLRKVMKPKRWLENNECEISLFRRVRIRTDDHEIFRSIEPWPVDDQRIEGAHENVAREAGKAPWDMETD